MSLTNMQLEMSAVGFSISSAGQKEDLLHIFDGGGGVGGGGVRAMMVVVHWASLDTERKPEICL